MSTRMWLYVALMVNLVASVINFALWAGPNTRSVTFHALAGLANLCGYAYLAFHLSVSHPAVKAGNQ